VQVLQRELLKEAGSLEYFFNSANNPATKPKQAAANLAAAEHTLKVFTQTRVPIQFKWLIVGYYPRLLSYL